MRRLMSLLCAVGILAAACSGGDDDAGGDEESVDSTEEGSDTEEEASATDEDADSGAGTDTSGDPDICPTITNLDATDVERPDPADNGDANAELVDLATYEDGQLEHDGEPVVENARTNACSKMADLPVLECRDEQGDHAVREAYVDLSGYLVWDPDLGVQRVVPEGLRDDDPADLERGLLIEILVADMVARADEGRVLGLEYVLFGQMGYGVHPATNPTRVDPGTYQQNGYPRQQLAGGGAVPIVVLDTGRPEELPDLDFLAGVPSADAADVEMLPSVTSDPGVAHGLMVGGVAGQAAPGAPIEIYNAEALSLAKGAAGGGGLFTLTSIKDALGRRPSNDPGVINMSFGTYSCDPEVLAAMGFGDDLVDHLLGDAIGDDPVVGMQPLRHFMDGLAERHILVASAGNNAISLPMFPAAFDSVIGVGAIDDTVANTIDADGDFVCGDGHVWQTVDSDETCGPDLTTRPWYSNHGTWVDVCAPGSDMVTAYPEGLDFGYLTYDHDKMSSTVVKVDDPGPLVMVSGTSMAAPHVAALLAKPEFVIEWMDAQGSVSDFLQAIGEPSSALAPCPSNQS